MAKAIDVAKYFLLLNQRLSDNIKKEDSDNRFEITPDVITHLKMQKLVYYAQGIHLCYTNKPLFDEEIQAWPHGPVAQKLYRELKPYKNKDLMQCFKDIKENELHLQQEEKEILQIVFNRYSKYSASALRNKTHAEAAWLEAYEKGKSNIITQEKIKKFFTAKKKTHVDNLYQESERFRCLFS